MDRVIDRVLGPRVSPLEASKHSLRYGLPGFLMLVARVLLLVSLFLPYWRMELRAPQYPQGLVMTAYMNSLTGDVAEIDGLNHYIGMRSLYEAAELERAAGVFIMIAFIVMLELAAYVHTRWAALLVAPVVLFPAVFLVDLHLWMRHFGLNLDPNAPLSNAVKPFVPTALGKGGIGQFVTIATPGVGLVLATAASLVLVAALYFHRRAYLPLVKARRANAAPFIA
ncbi:MAG: cytochrome C [Planctomyces sp.]|nr:cytochrome C [Planctomyces sp.]MBA4120402.1 cytochrome C [Isosphaera sp.]